MIDQPYQSAPIQLMFVAAAAFMVCSCTRGEMVPVAVETSAAEPVRLDHVLARRDGDGVIVYGKTDGRRLGFARRRAVLVTLEQNSGKSTFQRCIEDGISRRKDPVGSFAVRFAPARLEDIRSITANIRNDCKGVADRVPG